MTDQLTLDDIGKTDQEYSHNIPDWRTLTGPALDQAWRDAGSPLPVPYGCLPF